MAEDAFGARKDYEIEGEEENADLSLIKLTREYKQESRDARENRIDRNRMNREVARGRVPLYNKIEGQSDEFLPKMSNAMEQFQAFVRRALTQFGDWFSVDVPESINVTGDTIQKIIECHIERLPAEGRETQQFNQRLGDSVKSALTDSLMIFKVTGQFHRKKRFPGQEEGKGQKVWRLHIDQVRFEDYDFDPTGKNLYEIHTVERDISEVRALAEGENAIYKKEVVDQIEEDYRLEEEEQRERRRNEQANTENKPSFRKKIVIEECWGTILDREGNIVEPNAVWAIANDKYTIRDPEPNQFWHGESPFVRIPILRVPFSVYHKALADMAAPLNLAYNDLFNLVFDGGISSVWGIKTIRPDWLDNPEEIAGGIPQGKTIKLNANAPAGAPALDMVQGGEVPRESLAMLQLLQDEFNESMFVNDIRLGQLPPKQVKATEIVEAQQSSGAVIDSIATDIEDGLEKLLTKAWWVILQNINKLEVAHLADKVPIEELAAIGRMDKKEKFAFLGDSCAFKVKGLSSTLSRVKDMQKLLTIIQVVGGNPILNLIFWKQNSGQKIIRNLFKQLNLDPSDFEVDEDDQAQAQILQQFVSQGGGGPGTEAKSTGAGNQSSGNVQEPEL